MNWLRDFFQILKEVKDISPAVFALLCVVLLVAYAIFGLSNLTQLDFSRLEVILLALGHGTIFTIILGIFIWMLILTVRQQTEKKKAEESEEERIQPKDFDSFYEGLEFLKEWIDNNYSDQTSKATLLLWRVVPIEFTDELIQGSNSNIIQGLRENIHWYQRFVAEFIREGKGDRLFWDESIYGFLPIRGESRRDKQNIRKLNSATLKYICDNYLSTNHTHQTSGLGISDQLMNTSYILIINSSVKGLQKPSAYHCAVRWNISANGKPHDGQFITNPDTVRELSDSFVLMREELLDEAKQTFWYIKAETTPEELGQIQTKIESIYRPHCNSTPSKMPNNRRINSSPKTQR